ncbi:MAG: SusC/RagA family protein, partial [Chitinophagaceae bacterium]
VIYIAILLYNNALFSQVQTIKSKVTNELGVPLMGVSITIKGKKVVAVANAGEGFTLKNIARGEVVVFSYMGYTQIKEIIGGEEIITKKLLPLVTYLVDVAEVGYGTSRKPNLTGSLAAISSKDFHKGQISTPKQMITGKLDLVSIISKGGKPGLISTFRTIGRSLIRASNNLLIDINGVALVNDGIAGSGNPLSFINPNHIELFTV